MFQTWGQYWSINIYIYIYVCLYISNYQYYIYTYIIYFLWEIATKSAMKIPVA